MASILNHPSVQIAALILSGLFFLNQTRQRGIVLSLLCMVAWLGIVIIVIDMIKEPSEELEVIVSRRVEIIDEVELIQLGPIINTETEQEIIVLPNKQVQEAPSVGTSSWAGTQRSWTSATPAVARWQPYIMKAIAHCGLVTPGYDPALLMAAIVTQESSGNPNAMGKAHDTGLGQVVNNSHRLFPNRPSQQELLDPQFNLNFAACLLRDNLKRTGSVKGAVNAYNGNGVHNGRTYAEIIFGHYASFVPVSTVKSNYSSSKLISYTSSFSPFSSLSKSPTFYLNSLSAETTPITPPNQQDKPALHHSILPKGYVRLRGVIMVPTEPTVVAGVDRDAMQAQVGVSGVLFFEEVV